MAKKRDGLGAQSITWESVRRELNATRTDQEQIDYDGVRCRKLEALATYTKRPTVLYATDFLNEAKAKHVQNAVAINQQDVRGLAEVLRGLEGDSLDLILHSPGGSAEAAEAIVSVLRAQFKTVRVLVPVMAKSAATMIALAANEILMPRSAELGPIDPQFLLSDGRGGQRMTPAQAIIDDVQRAQQAVAAQQADAPVWLMQVQSQPPGLYQQALNAVQLSKDLVKRWLEQYMFDGNPNAAALAQGIVDFLGDHNRFLSHARRVDIQALANLGANIHNITDVDRQLWQLLEELWYVVEHTFQRTPVFKMWENSKGVRLFQMLQIQMVLSPTPEMRP
jgi:ATP-dependent protease ClpP protease subunit